MTYTVNLPTNATYNIDPADIGNIDAWFPRPERPQPKPAPPPEDGVIEGVKRPRQWRYTRKWYTQIKRQEAQR